MSNKNSSLLKSRKLEETKQKQTQKVHRPKPVIIQMDQNHSQHQKNNQLMIKKMIQNNNSNLKFSGGYKQSHNPNQTKSLYRPEGQSYQIKVGDSSKVYNVYEELGVSKNQSKYRIDENTSNNQPYSLNQLQNKIQLLKKDRQERNNSLLQPTRDVYTLADNKDRYQSVIHAKSSLDTISLQNIQAKLEAHRRGLKQIEDQYNAKKGKSTPIDRYGFMKVNIDVDKQYAQLQVDNDKVYELVRKREQMQPDQVQFEELWQMKKKNDPKLAEYDAKYQQYLISKGAKNLMGSFVRDNLYNWDKYKQPGHQHSKSKPKNPMRNQSSPKKHHSNQKQSNDDILNKNDIALKNELTLSTHKYGPDGLASVKDIKDVIAKKDDKFIAAYIFAQVDTSKVGLISKQELHDYLLTQEHIINGYNIDTKWLFTDLDNFETKRKGMFNKVQLSLFLVTLQKVEHPKLSLTNKSSVSMNNMSILGKTGTIEGAFTNNKGIESRFAKYKPVFQKLFKALDFNDDKIIKRTEYIENIFIDSDCVNILDENVITIKSIQKSIKVRQIIGFILDDYEKQRNQKLKKSKQYITFTRFCEYFDIPESLDLSKIDRTAIKKKQDSSTEFQIYDIPQQYLLLLKDIFNQIPRIYQDYIVSADFVQAALRDPQILALSDQLCRIESIQTRLPLQSIQTTLHRMQKQCDQYSDWESIKLYFSRRGRPLDWDYQLIVKKRQLRNKKFKEQKSNVVKSKLRQTQNYFKLGDQLKNKSKQKLSRIPDKYTVPQPFDITDMKQKPDPKQAKQGQKQFQQLKKQFKAAPVNKQILQPKPDLIAGKINKQKSEKKNEYKYQNYQNDRIQRALKRAQQQYQMQQKIKQIKQKAEVKAHQIGIDLTKKYMDVVKQEKKRRQNSNFKPTKPKASESLYPPDPANQKAKKIDKVKQNIQKVNQAYTRKKQLLEQQKNKAKQKNQLLKKKAEQAKKREKQQLKKRDQLANNGLDFKPKINKKQLTQKQKQEIEKARMERQRKQLQRIQKIQLAQQERRKKILDYNKKQAFLPIDNLTDDQILQRLDEINFQDLLDEKQKSQYKKQFDNKNKTLKELKQREAGLAGRQRAAMQQQQRRIMQQKRKYKEQVQKRKTNPNNSDNYSAVSGKGQKSAAFKESLHFHKSRALRRYRAIMDGKKPLSQFDKYSQYNKTEKGIDELEEESIQQEQKSDRQRNNKFKEKKTKHKNEKQIANTDKDDEEQQIGEIQQEQQEQNNDEGQNMEQVGKQQGQQEQSKKGQQEYENEQYENEEQGESS